ncbi:MAG: hypothetical protein Q9196_006400 [Gyalolechia fulgens]
MIQKIERLFREGQASPYDVDLRGNTLLHVVGGHIDAWGIRNLGKRTGLSQEVVLRSLVTFCENLDNLGVPLNWHSHKGVREGFFVHELIRWPPVQLDPDVLSHSLNRLCQMGLEIPSSALTGSGIFFDSRLEGLQYEEVMRISAFQKCDDVINGKTASNVTSLFFDVEKCVAFCSNEIHAAVLNRSAPHLRAALQRSRISIDEQNEVGQTPLHLASNWPCGLSLLLAHGADVEKTSNSGLKPVDYAIMYGCPEGVELLLKAGCSFDHGSFALCSRNIFEFAVVFLGLSVTHVTNLKLRGNYFEVVEIIIKDLALRRDSVSENSQILTSGNTQAGTFYRSLRGETPLLRSVFSAMHTVYHCPQLTVKVANVLWETGFREIDLLDEHDRTPLMVVGEKDPFRLDNNRHDVSEFSFWLYQKGASLYRPCPVTLQPDSEDIGDTASGSEHRVIHFLAAEFILRFDNKTIGLVQNEDTDLSLEGRQFLERVLLDDSSDNCLCACSRHGCIPATYFLKRVSIIPGSALRRIRWVLENVPSKNFPVPVSREIIRLTTFEKLELRHTCCEYIYEFVSVKRAEADEIRDEDRDGIQLLESLLPEFEEKLGDGDIKSFIDGYWTTRMEEVLAARDEEPVDRAGMREAGVIFCDDDGNDGDGSDDDGSDK